MTDYESLDSIKQELFDASPEVKSAFNQVCQYFSAAEEKRIESILNKQVKPGYPDYKYTKFIKSGTASSLRSWIDSLDEDSEVLKGMIGYMRSYETLESLKKSLNSKIASRSGNASKVFYVVAGNNIDYEDGYTYYWLDVLTPEEIKKLTTNIKSINKSDKFSSQIDSTLDNLLSKLLKTKNELVIKDGIKAIGGKLASLAEKGYRREVGNVATNLKNACEYRYCTDVYWEDL